MKNIILILLISFSLFAIQITPKQRIQDTNYQYVVSGGVASGVKIYSAYILNSGSASISAQSGYWLSSVTWNATGDVDVNFVTGIFSTSPYCIVTPEVNAANHATFKIASSTSKITIKMWEDGGNAEDQPFYITCIGE